MMASGRDRGPVVDTGDGGRPEDRNRFLPVLAAERALRAILLIGVGFLVVTHTHTDWGDVARRLVGDAGLDPSNNALGRLIAGLSTFTGGTAERDGGIAIGYGVLEAAEAYGLLRRRTWGEYLTVISTALLFVPEVLEITRDPTVLKVIALALNAAIVAYLVVRLVRRRRGGRRS